MSKFVSMGLVREINEDSKSVTLLLDSGTEVSAKVSTTKNIEVDDYVEVYKTDNMKYIVKLINKYSNSIYCDTRHPFVAIGERTNSMVVFKNVGNDQDSMGQYMGSGASVFSDFDKAYIGHSLNNYTFFNDNWTVSVYSKFTELKGNSLHIYNDKTHLEFKLSSKIDGSSLQVEEDELEKISQYFDENEENMSISPYALSILSTYKVYSISGSGCNSFSLLDTIDTSDLCDLLPNDRGDYSTDFSSIDIVLRKLDIEKDSILEFKIMLSERSDEDSDIDNTNDGILKIGSTKNVIFINDITFSGIKYKVECLIIFTSNGDRYEFYNNLHFGGTKVKMSFTDVTVDTDNINLPTLFSINNNSANPIEISNDILSFKFHTFLSSVTKYSLIGSDKIDLKVQDNGFSIDQYGTHGTGQ